MFLGRTTYRVREKTATIFARESGQNGNNRVPQRNKM